MIPFQALLLLFLGGEPSPGPSPRTQSDETAHAGASGEALAAEEARFVELLGEVPVGADPQVWARRLARLDPAPVLVLRWLGSGTLPASATHASPATDAERRATLSAVLEATARALGARKLLPLAMERVGAEAAGPTDLVALLEATRLVGDGPDLVRLLDVCDLWAERSSGALPLARLVDAIREPLVRSPAGLPRLVDAFSRAGERVRVGIVRAVSLSRVEGSRTWLAERLRRDRATDLTILTELGRPRACRLPLPAAVASGVRAYLEDPDPQYRRSAARAAARVGDAEFLRPLVALLDAPEEPVRREAQAALRAITGLSFGDRPDRWSVWLQAEERWFEGDGRKLLRRLTDPRPAVLVAVIEDLGEHRYRREELAREVAPLLTHTDRRVGMAACHALRRLGSAVVLEELRVAAESAAPLVARAAEELARRLSGARSPSGDDLADLE